MSRNPIHTISRNDIVQYTEQVRSTNGVFSMIQQSFTFDFATYQGIDDSDLEILVGRVHDDDLKNLLAQSVLLGDAGAKYTDHNIPGETGFKKTFLAFKRVGEKYDVVYCTATQRTQVNWDRIGAAMGFGAVVGGAIGGAALFVPGVNILAGAAVVVAGAVAGGAAAGAAAGVAAIIQQRNVSNVVMGYIGKELSDRNLLRIV
ncbi:unnamed protein product [Adineta steineri]|uniref:Uncharacterized protein n=1 Tax=Adineta steineri TaxID=433720 RepID=A0A815D4K8_9BILA|nr:unnamed protein product [Adineta steineri]CAF3606765.1 unnamed protein product [Adineta steineri]